MAKVLDRDRLHDNGVSMEYNFPKRLARQLITIISSNHFSAEASAELNSSPSFILFVYAKFRQGYPCSLLSLETQALR